MSIRVTPAAAWCILAVAPGLAAPPNPERPTPPTRKLGSPLFRHVGHITALAVAADGRYAASTTSGGDLRVWEVATGKAVFDSRFKRTQGHWYDRLWFSPEGRLIFVGLSPGGRLVVSTINWKGDGKRDFRLAGPVGKLAVSADGRLLAVTAEDTVTVYRTADGRRVRARDCGTQWAAAAIDNAGRRAILANKHNREFRAVDLTDGRVLHEGYLSGTAISPDGKRIVVNVERPAANRETATKTAIFDLDNGRTVAMLDESLYNGVLFSPAADRFLSAETGRARIFRIGRGGSVTAKKIDCGAILRDRRPYVGRFAWSAGGEYVGVAAAEAVCVYRAEDGKRIGPEPSPAGGWVRHEGNRVVTGNWEGDPATVWDAKSGRPTGTAINPIPSDLLGRVTRGEYPSGGGGGPVVRHHDRNGAMVTVSTAAGRLLYSARLSGRLPWPMVRQGGTYYIGPGGFPILTAPDGRWLLGEVQTLKQETTMFLEAVAASRCDLWDMRIGQRVASLPGPGLFFTSPSGRLIAALYQGRGHLAPAIRVIEAQTGRVAMEATPLTRWPGVAAFSPGDRTLAVAEGRGPVRLLDTATGRTIARFNTDGNGPVLDLAFSPDGTFLAGTTPGVPVVLWDMPR